MVRGDNAKAVTLFGEAQLLAPDDMPIVEDLMRAQRDAFEEMQAESGGQVAAVDRWQVIQQAVVLTTAALRAVEPRESADDAADAMGILFARSMAALQGALRPSP